MARGGRRRLPASSEAPPSLEVKRAAVTDQGFSECPLVRIGLARPVPAVPAAAVAILAAGSACSVPAAASLTSHWEPGNGGSARSMFGTGFISDMMRLPSYLNPPCLAWKLE